MKHLLILLLALSLATTAFSQNDLGPWPGIAFHKGDLASLFARAAAEQKPVYVDVYTSWCGPCKQMAKNIFPDSAVGVFMNARFISYKIDAEKGEGVAFAAKHKVAAYPTSLYFNPAGEMVYQFIGYEAQKEKYMATGQRALDEMASPENLLIMRRMYAAGQRETAFLYRYLAKLRAFDINGYEARDVAAATLKALPKGGKQAPTELLPIAFANGEGDPAVYEACYKEIDALKAAVDPSEMGALQSGMLGANQKLLPPAAAQGKAALQQRLAERRHIMQNTPGRDERSMAQDEAFMRLGLAKDEKHPEVLNPELPMFVKAYWLSQTDSSIKTENKAMQEGIRTQLTSYFAENKVPEERQREMMAEYMSRDLVGERLTDDINTFAWAYYQMKRPKPELEQAVTWMDYALKLRPAYAAGLDTRAHLLYAVGRKEDAIADQRQAVAQFEKDGDDGSEYRPFLEEMLTAKPAPAKPASAKPAAPKPDATKPVRKGAAAGKSPKTAGK